MARYPDFHTPEGIARRIGEGRGEGRGSAYKPYFTRFDVPSRGERRETYSSKCSRSIHLLSRLEYHLFLLAENDPEILDIREQYPLPLRETEALAERLNIAHPRYWRNQCSVVMTTDLVLTRRHSSGDERIEAWSGKYSDSLRHWRTVEKQRLERAWHESHGHSWKVMTERDVPATYISNLSWLHPLKRPDAILGYSAELPAKVDDAMRRLLSTVSGPLWHLAAQCDKALQTSQIGICLYMCRYLLATGKWKTDLQTWDRENQPLVLSS